jgi:hypothetical protein
VTSDSGALLAINRFDESGRTETTNATYMGRFLYTGQRYFGGFGLYRYKNRLVIPTAPLAHRGRNSCIVTEFRRAAFCYRRFVLVRPAARLRPDRAVTVHGVQDGPGRAR